MARCTAPVYGHNSASAAARCPACRGRYSSRYGGNSSYGAYSPSYGYSPPASGGSSSSGSGRSRKPRWSGVGSTIVYSDSQIRALTPVRDEVEKLASKPDLRDVFLCHAWDDRKEAAQELHDLLESSGVKVWFSEKDIGLVCRFFGLLTRA